MRETLVTDPSSWPQVIIDICIYNMHSHSHVPSKPITGADAEPDPVQVGVVMGGGGGALVDVVGRHGGRPGQCGGDRGRPATGPK